MKRTLLLVIGAFALVLTIFALTTGYFTQKLHESHTFSVELDEISERLQEHKEQLQKIEIQSSYYDTLAKGNNLEIAQLESDYNELLKLIQSNERLTNTEKTQLSRLCNLQRNNELILLDNAAKIGFKEFGFIGSMREIVHEIEAKFPETTSKILSLRRHEKDYIMRHDLHYAVLFHEEIDRWRKSGNFPIEVDTYESQFDSVIIHIENVDKLTTYVTHSKNSELNVLQQIIRKKRKNTIISAYSTSEQAKFTQYFTSILCMVLLIVGSIIIIRKITFQVSRLLKSMSEFVNSNYESNESIVKELPKNEIGQIAVHFIKMARKIRSEVLLLEDRVQRRTLSLEQKNGLLEKQHEEMMESLRYAQNLQQSMLVSRQQLLHHFSDARIHYSPKQHVGGDFFWMKEIKNSKEDKILFALADCTGHGVPGALLSVLGINTLDELFRSGISQPDSLLTALRETIVRRLNMQQDQCMDGMDIALVLWDKKSNELQFAGAQLPVWILRQGEIVELKGDRMPIGFTHHESNAYSLQKIQLEFGDRLLFFTDGLVDQFGMVSEKKMGKKQLRFILYKHLHESSVTIFNKVMSHFQFWKGTSEQTDDCTIIILEPLLKKTHRSKKQVEEKLLATV